jgi:tetratricopeptide (TPR) repeat protein
MAWARCYCPVSMVWRVLTLGRPGFFGALVLVLAAVAPVRGAPATDALIAEAGAALESGNADQAQRLADDALKAPGVTPLQRGRLLLDRGLAQELQGRHDEAMVDFAGAIETHALPADERAQALLQRGFLLDGMNRLDDAAKDYGAAANLKSSSMATALNNRANVYRRQNRQIEARRDYQAALAAGTTRPQFPYFGLGEIAEAQQDKEAARGFYAKALAADPGYRLASERLAQLGGAPEGTLAEPDVIKLRPPGPKPAKAPQAAASAAIVLRPPAGRKSARASPGLRPALDGPSGSVGQEVQLGAWRSEPEAQAGWDKAKGRPGATLDGKIAHIVRAEVPGGGVYFRLRVKTPSSANLCASLKANGLDCMIIRN